MKKRTFFSAILIVCCIFAVSLIGGANYLLNYALKPGDRSRNEALAWHEIDSLYPGMIQWRDSLQTAHALKDTTIITPRQDTLHAWYIAAPQPTATTAVLVHGYTDCAIRMMPLGRMYNRQLNTNILLPDLYNAGRSSGNHFQMGWNDRLDIKQWTNLIVPQLFGDSARIVVHGVSMGAATTMMLSGDKDVSPSVMAYIEDCGYTSVAEQFSKELKEQFNLPQWPLIPLAQASEAVYAPHAIHSWQRRCFCSDKHGLPTLQGKATPQRTLDCTQRAACQKLLIPPTKLHTKGRNILAKV